MKLSVLIVASLAAVACGQNMNRCGRNLATALANICDMSAVKRSRGQDMLVGGEGMLAGQDALGGGQLLQLPRWPWMSRHRSKTLGRSKRQIVSECCEKACTNDELLSYCDY